MATKQSKNINSTTEYSDISSLIQTVIQKYSQDDYIHASSIPDLGLYVDQITTLLSNKLDKTRRFDNDKIMTKTMINNYTKNHLLPPPLKKKYSRDHILLLIFIYYFKSFLPISDIQTLLKPLTDDYFNQTDETGNSFETIYTTLFSKEAQLIDKLAFNIQEELEMSKKMFTDYPEKEKTYLQNFSLICILSLDIYIKKQCIESIIDQMQQSQ